MSPTSAGAGLVLQRSNNLMAAFPHFHNPQSLSSHQVVLHALYQAAGTMGSSKLLTISLQKSMASWAVDLLTMSSHTQVGSPSFTHTHFWPGCTINEHGKEAGVKTKKLE
jgi:hypothetical protein